MLYKNRIVAVAILSTVFLVIGAASTMEAPLFYSAKETRAKIVDEQTVKPVEGAVVIAQWLLDVVSGRGLTLHIAAAVTDKNGQFYIPGWGPKPRRPFTQLGRYSPQILIFKHGYKPLWLHNESMKDVNEYFPGYKNMRTKDLREGASWYKGDPTARVQVSMWNGLNIQIEQFSGTSDDWLDSINDLLSFLAREDDKEIRQLFTALAVERTYFKANPVGQRRQDLLLSLYFRIDQALK